MNPVMTSIDQYPNINELSNRTKSHDYSAVICQYSINCSIQVCIFYALKAVEFCAYDRPN